MNIFINYYLIKIKKRKTIEEHDYQMGWFGNAVIGSGVWG